MILYLKALKIPPKKNLIITFGKVAGYKINIQKPVDFLYTNNELAEKEIKIIIPFAIASKKTT
jgi:hypothetical protein